MEKIYSASLFWQIFGRTLCFLSTFFCLFLYTKFELNSLSSQQRPFEAISMRFAYNTTTILYTPKPKNISTNSYFAWYSISRRFHNSTIQKPIQFTLLTNTSKLFVIVVEYWLNTKKNLLSTSFHSIKANRKAASKKTTIANVTQIFWRKWM